MASACGAGSSSYGPNDLLGALSEADAVDGATIECVDDRRSSVAFTRTVDALGECTDVQERRDALIEVFGFALDQGVLSGTDVPAGIDVDEFGECALAELADVDAGVVDQIWNEATSSTTLGEGVGAAVAAACVEVIFGSLGGDVAVSSDDLIDAVLGLAGTDRASVSFREFEQDGVLVTYVPAPIEFGTVSNPVDGVVISVELVVQKPPTQNEVDATKVIFDAFGIEVADHATLFDPLPREINGESHVACVESAESGVSVRVLPLGFGCERL